MNPVTASYDIGILRASIDKIKNLFRTSNKKLILSFIKIEDNIHIGIPHCGNQILVLFKTGEFMLFQKGVMAKDINRLLGPRRKNVKYWTVLPMKGSKENPINENREYYNDPRYENIYTP